jgi:predicted acylesterase/phospholipase RssA
MSCRRTLYCGKALRRASWVRKALIAGETGLGRMLYEAERHESLTASAWNEQVARACINEILDDAVDKFSARDLWPSHPLDSFSLGARWNLYVGAAGTIWALHHLSPKPDSLPDFSIVVPRLLEPNRSWILNVKGVKNNAVTPDVLLASACLPTMFQAIEIDGEPYWDGGYSGNPTITPLIRECKSQDTILVQINPVERERSPRSASEILNRLNEVSINAPRLQCSVSWSRR